MMKPWFGWGFCWGWAVGQLNRMILKPLYTMEMWKIAELWYLWARWDVWQMGWMVAGTWKVGSIIQQSNLYCKVFVERIRHNSTNLWAQRKGFQNFGYIFDFWSNSSELPKNEKNGRKNRENLWVLPSLPNTCGFRGEVNNKQNPWMPCLGDFPITLGISQILFETQDATFSECCN